MRREVGQCWEPMVDLDDPAPRSVPCLDDDRALALVDGQLSRQAREEIEAHLDVCATCRRFVSELAKESLFESPTEQATDLEQTGYAPGRPGLLDVALTVRDLAATRVGVPDVETPASQREARGEVEGRVPPPQPMQGAPLLPPEGAATAKRPARSRGRSSPQQTSAEQPSVPATSSASDLEPWLLVVVVIALSLSALTVIAALTSLAALGYVVFRS